MSLKRNIYQQMIEFNKKTFQEKAKRRRQEANLPFEKKLKIVEELNALVRDFTVKRLKSKPR